MAGIVVGHQKADWSENYDLQNILDCYDNFVCPSVGVDCSTGKLTLFQCVDVIESCVVKLNSNKKGFIIT